MRSLFRLLSPTRIAAKPPSVQRDSVSLVLADGRRIDVLRVRDPRARRIKLSVDERGARLTLPLRASLVAGDRFLHTHRDWLALQLAAHATEPRHDLVRDATAALPLRGEDVPVRWADGRATRLDIDAGGFLENRQRLARSAAGGVMPDGCLHGAVPNGTVIERKRTIHGIYGTFARMKRLGLLVFGARTTAYRRPRDRQRRQ